MSILIWELIYMSACVFAVGFGLHALLIKKGFSSRFFKEDSGWDADYEGASKNEKSKKTGNSVLDKWISLGGGYYGSVALVKLIFIELGQFGEFVINSKNAISESGFAYLLDGLTLGALIAFFIEQIMNAIQAMMWPVHYLGRFDIFGFAIFIVSTYFVYEASRKMAFKQVK